MKRVAFLFLVLLAFPSILASECIWTQGLDANYAAKQFKDKLSNKVVRLHLESNNKSLTTCIESWLDTSQFEADSKGTQLWVKYSKDSRKLIFQTLNEGLSLKIPQKKNLHPFVIVLGLLLLFLNNRNSKKANFTQVIDGVNDLTHLLHNQQNQDLVFSSNDTKKYKKLKSDLNLNIEPMFYFKQDNHSIKYQTLKSEVSTIITECLQYKTIDSATRKLYLKKLSKYSSYCYLNLQDILKDTSYKVLGETSKLEISFYYTQNTNWSYHQRQLKSILLDWMDITYDNAKKYSQGYSPNFEVSKDQNIYISISNPSSLNPQNAALIKEGKIQELSKIKKRSTGYPKLLMDINKYNETLKPSQQDLFIKVSLKQDEDLVIATLSIQDQTIHSDNLKILIIDDDSQSKYFQHQKLDECLSQHTVTIAESFVECEKIKDHFDLILMDRNFPVQAIDSEFVTINEIQALTSQFNPERTYLVSTDSSDCHHLFLKNHILSVREVPRIIANSYQTKFLNK